MMDRGDDLVLVQCGKTGKFSGVALRIVKEKSHKQILAAEFTKHRRNLQQSKEFCQKKFVKQSLVG